MTDEIYPYLVMSSRDDIHMRIAQNITIPVSRDALKRLALNSVEMCINVDDGHAAAVVVDDQLKKKLETGEELTRRLMQSRPLSELKPPTNVYVGSMDFKGGGGTTKLEEAMDDLGDQCEDPVPPGPKYKKLITECKPVIKHTRKCKSSYPEPPKYCSCGVETD